MNKITLATTNPAKYAGLDSLLEEKGIVLLSPSDPLIEIQALDLCEVGTFKAISLFNRLNEAVLVDDAGLFLEAYPGFPGSMTKLVLETIGLSGIQKLLEEKTHRASLVCTITLCQKRENVLHFQGKIDGHIREVSPTSRSLPLNNVFVPEGEVQTLVELKKSTPKYPDHRIMAFQRLAEYLKDELIEKIL